MEAHLDRIDSPVSPVAFATDGDGALLILRFSKGGRPLALEEGLDKEGFFAVLAGGRVSGPTTEAREQLTGYFVGECRSFDLAVARRGSSFQQAVWKQLSRIPFGETRTYGQVAEAIGGSAKEVGAACAANPVLLVVPWHRLVGADGSLKGYAGGLPLTARLLNFEEERQKPLFV